MMTFQEFLRLSEEASSGDKGLMGYNVPTRNRKPSDRQPSADLLSPVAGDKGSTGGGGAGGGGGNGGPVMGGSSMFMTKKMKKT